jgi:hypothetical protein
MNVMRDKHFYGGIRGEKMTERACDFASFSRCARYVAQARQVRARDSRALHGMRVHRRKIMHGGLAIGHRASALDFG